MERAAVVSSRLKEITIITAFSMRELHKSGKIFGRH